MEVVPYEKNREKTKNGNPSLGVQKRTSDMLAGED
jgi:hypothetical protein